MSFSDLVHRVEADVSAALLPRDAPSDTREADALAKAAAGVAVSVDPELAPLFERVGVLGNYVEQALTELGTILGDIKGIIATRAQQVPPPSTPLEAVNPDPSAAPAPTDTAPVDSGAGSAAPSDAASASVPASTTDSTSAGMAAVGESSAPASTPPAPAPSDTPTSIPAPTSEPNPVEDVPAAATPDAATAAAESAFGALTPEERARFDADEELDPMGSIATAEADANAGTDAGIAAATGSTPPPPA